MKIAPLAAVLSAALLASSGAAQNLLTNPDFEAGLTGWTFFGNAFPESENPPATFANSGTEMAKIFGNFSGGFNVTGILQAFSASEGDMFELDCFSAHFSADPLTGPGAPGANWAVQKIAFFDAANNEIAGFEGTIVDGTSPVDTWIDNAPVQGTAPAGTVRVEALFLFLQPGSDGGSAYIEDASFTTLAPPVATTPNLLVNGDFEAGLGGWGAFGNAFAEATNPPEIVPQSGSQVAKLFGNFSGGFNVSGIFQGFGAVEGQTFIMDCASRHWSGDPVVGVGPPNDNWMVMKIAFFDAGNAEIGAAEAIVIDGTSPTDVWIDNAPISGTAPAGTVRMEALILYLQPAFAGGGAQVDDVLLTTSSGCELAINGGFETGDYTGWQNFETQAGQQTIVSPGSGSTFAARLDNQVLASASLIKNPNLGIGQVVADETITLSIDARGTTAVGGVVFFEIFSEGAGGVSKAEILGGAPLALDADPTAWTTFTFTTTLGPDVTNGVTLQVAAITGAAIGSVSTVEIDNVSATVERLGAAWGNYGAGHPGTNGEPTLTLGSNPVLGQSLDLLIGSSDPATTAGIMIFGAQQANLATVFGGTILNDATVWFPLPALAPGTTTIPVVLPPDAEFCGTEVYAQVIHVDAGASAGIAFSSGLRFVFGGGN